jgi:small subunit ribosomal protein S21
LIHIDSFSRFRHPLPPRVGKALTVFDKRTNNEQIPHFKRAAVFSACGGQPQTLLLSTAPSLETHQEQPLQIIVRDNNIDQALKALKKKMQREGIFREMKLRGHYEKPSEKRARERAEAIRRYRKLQRKRLQREGVLPK